MISTKTASTFRKYHRYLGFFLAGIMIVYATSGSLLVFRTTDFLEYQQIVERTEAPGFSAQELEPRLRLKGFKLSEEHAEIIDFGLGTYDKGTGKVIMQIEDYPPVLSKMVALHKATTNSPLFFMNLFFGASLMFFSISAFFMFVWKLPTYRSGLKFAAAGFLMAVTLVMLG